MSPSLHLQKTKDTVHVLQLSAQMKAVMTFIRTTDIPREDFVFFADRIVRFVVEEGLNYVPCMRHVLALCCCLVACECLLCGVRVLPCQCNPALPISHHLRHTDTPVTIQTPTQANYDGLAFGAEICGVR